MGCARVVQSFGLGLGGVVGIRGRGGGVRHRALGLRG